MNQNNVLPPPRRDRGVRMNVAGGRSSDITGRSLGQVALTHRCTVGRGAKNSRSRRSGAKKTFRFSESRSEPGAAFRFSLRVSGFDVFSSAAEIKGVSVQL